MARMKMTAHILILVLVTLSAPCCAAVCESDPSTDALVYEAVLENKIRPQARRLLGHTDISAPIHVIICDSTIAVCSPAHFGECIPEQTFERLGMLLDGNDALVSEFRSENLMRHSIATLNIPGALIVPEEQIREVQERESERTKGSVVFGTPCYTHSGHAIVYATYHCGSLCGYSWLFLLKPAAVGWQVVASEMLGIS